MRPQRYYRVVRAMYGKVGVCTELLRCWYYVIEERVLKKTSSTDDSDERVGKSRSLLGSPPFL